jgi:lipoprotein-releasing system permease protein
MLAIISYRSIVMGFRSLPLFIGLRYSLTKQGNRFIAFMTATAILGIGLGMTVLITVLSVMNGFDEMIQVSILNTVPPITIRNATHYSPALEDPTWRSLREIVLQHPQVQAAAPFVTGYGLLVNKQQHQPILLQGILPHFEEAVSPLFQRITQGHFTLQAGHSQMILNESLALILGIKLGDKLTLLAPVPAPTTLGLKPKMKIFTVTGLLQSQPGLLGEPPSVYTHLEDALNVYQLSGDKIGLTLKVQNFYHAPQIAQDLRSQVPKPWTVQNWVEEYGSFLVAIALEKNIFFIILLLLLVMAGFNLISSLMLLVTDKQKAIAILRSLGASPLTIMKIFMIQGSFIGLIGTVLGLTGGILLARHLAELIAFIEQLFNIQLFNAQAYFSIERIPSKLLLQDLIKVTFFSLSISVLATIYPARRASQIAPAEALRHE